MSRLTLSEERAERALFMAQHPMARLSNQPKPVPKPEDFADIIDQLIECGRIVR